MELNICNLRKWW